MAVLPMMNELNNRGFTPAAQTCYILSMQQCRAVRFSEAAASNSRQNSFSLHKYSSMNFIREMIGPASYHAK
jgi:hypothetical protein